MSECPRRVCITLKSAPLFKRCVAKACLNVCGDILNGFRLALSEISEENLFLLKKHNFKIINFTEDNNESNFDNYISCQETHNDMKTYCDRYDCNGVIVRPDKYVYDLINYGDNDNLEVVISNVLRSLKEKVDL